MESENRKATDGILATGTSTTRPHVTEHPLEKSERTFAQRQGQLEMAMLRKTQGIHLPLRLQAERRSLAKVGHLPFLYRNESALHALTGQDELIGFDDFLGHPECSEVSILPHALLERSHGFH